ncbi:MAG TPA: hypothetical protein PKC49_00270 [Phycisphaerae bacterium]|nr:hypothetical protein [Phycisphaerae bacterium]
MADPVEDALRENAQGPKRAQGDSGSVERHALADQIEADRYLASKEAAKKGAAPQVGARQGLVVTPS